MNRFGLNGAAINATAIRVIAGAAIAVCSFTAQGSGLRTQYGSATISSQIGGVADGTRTQLGQAVAVTNVASSAKWALLTLAEANATSALVVKAGNTEAYAGVATQITANGTAIRNAAAVCPAKVIGSADGVVTVGYAATVVISSDALADASVKPSGSANWYRDGYAKPVAVQIRTSAMGLRTALATANAGGASNALADAVRTQGGVAICAIALHAEATGASDTAWCTINVLTSASGVITRFGSAQYQSNLTITITDTVIRPGQVETVNVGLISTANGRLAQRGDAIGLLNTTVLADGRLGLIGGAFVTGKSSGNADGVVYKVGEASLSISLIAAGDGYILRMGESIASASLTVTADGATNLQARASDDRTMMLLVEERGISLQIDDRSMRLV